jgi:hypothetical protein
MLRVKISHQHYSQAAQERERDQVLSYHARVVGGKGCRQPRGQIVPVIGGVGEEVADGPA